MTNPLFIIEIFEIVCSFAREATLAYLAQTCRAFEGLSLTVLWKELETIDHLVRLLPDSIWEDSEDFTTTRLLQPPSLEHWRRLRQYTSRITVINLSDGEIEWPPVDNRRVLLASLQPPEEFHPIFPNVKEVKAHPLGDENWMIPLYKFPWLNEASVKEATFTLQAGEEDEKVMGLIRSFGNLYPNTTRASVWIWPESDVEGSDELIASVSSGIRGWKHLEHGSFNALDTLAYEHLARSEHLKSLWLNLKHTLGLFRQDAVPRAPFPALTELSLTVDDISSFVRWIRPRSYSLLSLNCVVSSLFPSTTLVDQLLSFCSSVSSQVDHRTLQELCLGSFSKDHHKTPVWAKHTIRPLFVFTHLRSLVLSGLCMIYMDDAVLQELASAFPLLEILLLECYDIPQGRLEADMSPTFLGFFHLVENCPRLRELSILIDMKSSDRADLPDHYGASNHLMSKLTLGRSPLDDSQRVARIIRTIFPSLKRVDTAWLTNMVGGWEESARLNPVEEELKVSLSLWNDVNTYLTNSE